MYCCCVCRVGEEREQAVNQLHGERENYEKQLLTLVDQQEKILQEREGNSPLKEDLNGVPVKLVISKCLARKSVISKI